MVGEAMYGDRWQTPLAQDLGVTPRTVRNWCAERRACPADMATRLLPLVENRVNALRVVAGALKGKR